MDSANFHHRQQEDHQLLVDSSCYDLAWYQNPILNGTRNHTNSRDVRQHMINDQSIDLSTSTPPMAQDMRLPWGTTSNTCTSISMEGFMAHELQHLARIKHELSVSGSYPEVLSEIISSSPTSSIEDLHLQPSPSYMSKNNHQRIRYNNNNNQDMFLKTFSNGCQIKGDQLMNLSPSSVESISYSNDTNSCYRGTFSQILPTVNISSLNQSSTSSLAMSSSSFDINLPALDPFGSPTFDGSFSYQPSSLNGHNFGGLFKETCLSYGPDQMHPPNHTQEVCVGKISPAPAFIMETTEAKRPASNYLNANAPKGTPPKKSKQELRPSCAPLKVRKEKLGDRISALQQMVAPFGKTDTASVLMEAIGYIKFLQNQVETLSVPYMNSAHKPSRTSTRGGSIKDGNEETKRDLRSRGLCLVPLSCLSYVTYGCGSVWATP